MASSKSASATTHAGFIPRRWPDPAGPRVIDDGQGIPPEYHSRIFDKFVQVTDPNGTPLRKGTGLGLAFCRLAVAAHGGQIRVESAPGQGSVFTFSLPINGA